MTRGRNFKPMNTLLLSVHIFTCIVLIIVVLIQSGKDGGIGMMSSGGGSSQTIFGSSGGANFFTKFTSITAMVFMLTSIGLTVSKSGKKKSVFEDAKAPITNSAPAPVKAAEAPVAAPVIPTDTKTNPAPAKK